MKLEFNDDFFKEETREDFFIEEEMKRAWAAELEILKAFSDVCEKHGLKWTVAYGSLIGTVRHKGFIPWDDDLDVFMPRPDYELFRKKAIKDLPKDFYSMSIHTHTEWSEYLLRIVNHPNIDMSAETMNKYHGCPYCCGIDVFPLDYIPEKQEDYETYKALIDLIANTAENIAAKIFDRDEERKLLAYIEKIIKTKIDRGRNIPQQLRELCEKILGMYKYEEVEYMGVGIRQIKFPNYYFSKHCFDEIIMMPFEGTEVPVPVGYDEVLKTIYGDYMTCVKYISHDYPFYKSQKELLKSLNK